MGGGSGGRGTLTCSPAEPLEVVDEVVGVVGGEGDPEVIVVKRRARPGALPRPSHPRPPSVRQEQTTPHPVKGEGHSEGIKRHVCVCVCVCDGGGAQ